MARSKKACLIFFDEIDAIGGASKKACLIFFDEIDAIGGAR
ncbi:unnamed protein product [Plutella xylostella]|uniref:(diamondback moth) hypothetical protein n=1 Tax=Plutella xylostella TaxID=51655 RepID=A0A8S4FT78_PLUXY|nr:unnamed protein product [Plutella xylostella]